MKTIVDHLKQCRNVFLASHIEPDGDALGSLIAMGLSLKAININITLYNESPTPAIYRFLPGSDTIVKHIDSVENYDAAVILDCGSLSRIGDAAEKVGKIPVIINIDHHITNDNFGTYRFVDKDSCATAAIIYRLIKILDVPITMDMACSIYTGILTDTGSFRFSNTNRDSFGICEEMVSIGVKPSVVAQNVYGTYSLGRIKLLNMALDALEISKNGKLSIMTLTESMLKKTNTTYEDIVGLINYGKRIEDVKVAVLIQEYPNGNGKTQQPKKPNGQKLFHISLRSDGSIDVSKIAAIFGGGGHINAAGFDIETNLSYLKKEIFHLAEKL